MQIWQTKTLRRYSTQRRPRSNVDTQVAFPHFSTVKTITTRQAVRHFKKFSKMANAGERILVTHAGEPWVVFEPPRKLRKGRAPAKWPDYPAHWRKHFSNGPSRGPTATELLAQEKEDRF